VVANGDRILHSGRRRLSPGENGLQAVLRRVGTASEPHNTTIHRRFKRIAVLDVLGGSHEPSSAVLDAARRVLARRLTPSARVNIALGQRPTTLCRRPRKAAERRAQKGEDPSFVAGLASDADPTPIFTNNPWDR
jgi:hypothetical protein